MIGFIILMTLETATVRGHCPFDCTGKELKREAMWLHREESAKYRGAFPAFEVRGK